LGFGRALGLVHSAISNLKSTIRLPAAFAEEDDVDGFEEDPEIKKEGQISKGEEIRLRFPIPLLYSALSSLNDPNGFNDLNGANGLNGLFNQINETNQIAALRART
jgi:hypothetical protein